MAFKANAQYTTSELTTKFLDIEKKLKRLPKTKEFVKLGLPHIGFYNRAFGNYTNFLKSIGKKVKDVNYAKKVDPKRFFYPQEWIKFLSVITNQDHKMWFEFMLHTGARINEIRGIHIKEIDVARETIFLSQTKGGRKKNRTIKISSYLKSRLLNYAKANKLGPEDTFGIPSTQYLDKSLKNYCKEAGIKDYDNFSCHNLRKTTEMYLVTMGINPMAIISHIGHNIDMAMTHYVSSSLFTNEDRILIKSIMDNLLCNAQMQSGQI